MGWRGILGFEYGIVQAPMGPDMSGPELVAAVANAGGIGFLRAPDTESPDLVRELIRRTRALTDKPFGVGVVLQFPHKQNIQAILDEKVACLEIYWGECTKELVDQCHFAGVKLVYQLGSVEDAKKAVDLGVDAIIVQGHEAGGHVLTQDSLLSLVPRIAEVVGDRDIPVIAAGGIADARGYVAALALGARGVCMGTRFLATNESFAHPTYKKKLLEYQTTEYTDLFGRARWPDAPMRVLTTPFYKQWKSLPPDQNELNQPVIAQSTINGQKKNVSRFAGTAPNATTEGDIESMAFYAGEGVGLIKEILPAGEVVRRIVREAQLLINYMSVKAKL